VTRIWTDVDFDREGKQVSVLRMPVTRDTAGLATVAIPIIVCRNGAGPTVLLTAGTHGDEYEGPVALMKLARELTPEEVRGTVILLPALNLPAVRAGRRLSPLDQRDLNRCYPGDPSGSPSQMIAHYVAHELFPRCDLVLDHHSGGFATQVMPFMVVHDVADREVMGRSLAAAEAYGTRLIAVWRGVDPGKNQLAAAEGRGLAATCAEIGGSGRLTPETLRMTEFGVRNALRACGVLAGEPVSREAMGLAPARMVHTPTLACNLFAPLAGIFEAYHAPGDEVEAGQPAGAVHFVEEPLRAPVPVLFEHSGVLFAVRGPGWVESGDGVAIVASDCEVQR